MTSDEASKPIAIFDSGVGGLTVAQAVRNALPHESILYLADTASRPFGTKSPEQLYKIVEKNIALLLSYPIKMIVIACHTACSCGLSLFKNSPVPIITIFPTALDLLSDCPRLNSLLLLGTQRTIDSQMYQQVIQTRFPNISSTFIACSPLEQLIEGACQDPGKIISTLNALLVRVSHLKFDAAFLACTHFPIYQQWIQQALGPSCAIIDPAFYFSTKISAMLKACDLLNSSTASPQDQYLITGPLEPFKTKFLCYFGETLAKTTTCFNHPYATL